MIVAIAGATGLTGQLCLKMLLENPQVTRVIAIGRRSVGFGHAKLSESILTENKLSAPVKCDAFISCLGTTNKEAGSQETYIAIDYTLPVYLARELRAGGCASAAVVTAMGADEKSMFFYNRLKGKVEHGFRDVGFKSLTFLRPAMILGDRKKLRPFEAFAASMTKILDPVMVGPLKNGHSIESSLIARGLMNAALKQEPGVHVFKSGEIPSITYS